MLTITKLRTQIVDVPIDEPVGTAIHQISSVGCVLLTIETNEGIFGESYVFSINAVRIKVFNEMIQGLKHQIEGKSPYYVEAIWHNIWNELNPSGQKGITISALSAIDTACWDILGKAANLPLHRLWGACRDRIKTYASGGLWLSNNDDELVEQAQQYIKQGFQAMKIRVGSEKLADDVRRVAIVREAVGDDVELMVDVNQGLTPKPAIQLARLLEPYNLVWMEEPVAANDLRGHAQVCASVDMAIASGESEYSRYGMRDMIDHSACDILMPDLQRIGGLSEMRRVAHLAQSYHIPISTHIFTHQSLCVAGAVDNCISVEYIPWFDVLFNQPLQIKQGDLIIPNRVGIGFTFNQDAIKHYRVA